MQSSYRLRYYRTNDAGQVVECAVLFHEGGDGVNAPNGGTGYVRSGKLDAADLPRLAGRPLSRAGDGSLDFVFTHADFGNVPNATALHGFLRRELAKDQSRTPVAAQRV
jgi:hypothetical protein